MFREKKAAPPGFLSLKKPEMVKMKEDYFDCHIPTDQYGFSKYIMTKYAQKTENIYNLRLYSVYGPGTDWRYTFINNSSAKAALGQPIRVPRIGKCDYLHINDLCNIVEYYILNFKNLPKSRDICSGDVLSTEEIINYIKEIIELKEVIPHNKVSSTVSRSQSSLEAYFGDPNFVSCLPVTLTPVEEGIRELINFYQSSQPDPSLFVY